MVKYTNIPGMYLQNWRLKTSVCNIGLTICIFSCHSDLNPMIITEVITLDFTALKSLETAGLINENASTCHQQLTHVKCFQTRDAELVF